MTMAEAFNEWMRRVSETPGSGVFYANAVRRFRDERSGKRRPTYGDEAAAYLRALMRQPKRVVGKSRRRRAKGSRA